MTGGVACVPGGVLVHTLKTFSVLNSYPKLLFHLVVAPIRREIDTIETKEGEMNTK